MIFTLYYQIVGKSFIVMSFLEYEETILFLYRWQVWEFKNKNLKKDELIGFQTEHNYLFEYRISNETRKRLM